MPDGSFCKKTILGLLSFIEPSVKAACNAAVDVARKASRFRDPDDALCEYAVKKLFKQSWQREVEHAIDAAQAAAKDIERKGTASKAVICKSLPHVYSLDYVSESKKMMKALKMVQESCDVVVSEERLEEFFSKRFDNSSPLEF